MPERDLAEFLYDYLANEVEEVFKQRIPDYVRKANFQLDYSKEKVYDTLRWIAENWGQNLASEDWYTIYERQGLRGVRQQLNHIASGTYDYALDFTERDFGYSQEGGERPENVPELGRKLWEFIQQLEDSFFAQINQDVRASDFVKAKRLVQRFNNDILNWILIEITRAGYR